MLRLLILSDIHLMSLLDEMDPKLKFRKEFIKDIKDYRDTFGSIDHILVSGDIANTGNSKEYDYALGFFTEICDASGCPEEEVYVVPGNHDKNFNADNSEIRHIIDAGLSNERADADKLFCELLQNDFDHFKKYFQPFRDYNDFATRIDSQEPLMAKGLDEMSTDGYDAAQDKAFLKRELNQIGVYKVYLYAMNTALVSDWFDVNDYDKGHYLYLPRLSYNANVEIENCINIAMMHHPTSRLVNGQEIADVLNKNYQIQIFGHLHKSASDTNGCFHINSGAMQPPVGEGDESDGYFSVFNILEMDVESRGNDDYLKVQLRVEKYNETTETFEEVAAESRCFETKLKRHCNRWDNMTTQQVEDGDNLPEGITVRKVRYSFLHVSNQKAIICQLSEYDADKSFSENCVSFLKRMENEHRMLELWNALVQK